MHLAKHVVSALATPLAIALIIACAAALCRGFGRRRASFSLVIVAAAVAYLGAIALVGSALLAPLERAYPPLTPLRADHVDYVVVLGSGYEPRDGIPVTAALDYDGVVRVVEGIRLVRQLNAAHLVVSGGAPPGRAPPAAGYARLARELGVDRASLIVLDKPLDTASEAAEIVALLRDTPFILVTSAYHMPRAVRLTEALGGRPIPAPTGQRVNESARWDWDTLLPSSAGLRKTERALHEYLGLIANSLGVR